MYDQTGWMPQIAVGAQYKRDASIGGLGALGITNVKQLGAKDDKGTDFYLSATKIYFKAEPGFVNGTAHDQSQSNGFGDLVAISKQISAAVGRFDRLPRQS